MGINSNDSSQEKPLDPTKQLIFADLAKTPFVYSVMYGRPETDWLRWQEYAQKQIMNIFQLKDLGAQGLSEDDKTAIRANVAHLLE